jgi:hypothetical protein
MSTWTGKPCVGCDGRKGPKYADLKFCGKCARTVRRQASQRRHRAVVAKTYGLPLGGYDRLLEAQEGLCALCRRANGRTRRLSVDHDHSTNEVRGLLCRPCNNILGHARDDVDFFVRALAYLVFPPAREALK